MKSLFLMISLAIGCPLLPSGALVAPKILPQIKIELDDDRCIDSAARGVGSYALGSLLGWAVLGAVARDIQLNTADNSFHGTLMPGGAWITSVCAIGLLLGTVVRGGLKEYKKSTKNLAAFCAGCIAMAATPFAGLGVVLASVLSKCKRQRCL